MFLEDQTYAVIGAAIEVLNELGHGIHEKPYENALLVELRLRAIACEQQTRFNVIYKTVKVGKYVPDLIAAGKIIVETKVVDRIRSREGPNDQLSPNHSITRRAHLQFPILQIAVGKDCSHSIRAFRGTCPPLPLLDILL
jgi:GxxExxY protein